jgi:hypothetical protein
MKLAGFISVREITETYNGMLKAAKSKQKPWSVQKMRRRLKAERAVVRKGHDLFTTRSLLRTCFPEIYHELFLGKF